MNHSYSPLLLYVGLLTDVRGKVEIRPEKVLLLHKMEKVTPGAGIRFELGGEIAAQELGSAVAGMLYLYVY